MIKVAAIIVAGGKGLRMKSDKNKQYLEIGKHPILSYTLLKINRCKSVDKIFLVIPKEDFEYCLNDIISRIKLNKKIKLVKGGKDRQESVYNGLSAMKNEFDLVVIHDGVRPFVRIEDVEAAILMAAKHKACILGLPVNDTLKKANPVDECIIETTPRADMYLAQTPQVFEYNLVKEAHDKAIEENFKGTDDASLVEQLGVSVKIIEGRSTNIKITNNSDFILARAIANLEKTEKKS
jgi:2-C-methyl-D-erythritol 4-phosphate cytidylyltransferase